ncbi:hypothetical protein [Nonomuraea jabiensis]|uniref:Uncharacterized protein n=1 Tax=Nonomuraea jabiensis TaxID=882448 RepID=A0A7W9GBQ7_9ACTN|nr:hypothetical protein [Nonomuraea jabiensis]MBB5780845.1 hypothetical protein [Nonomuraea jabiensis]
MEQRRACLKQLVMLQKVTIHHLGRALTGEEAGRLRALTPYLDEAITRAM